MTQGGEAFCFQWPSPSPLPLLPWEPGLIAPPAQGGEQGWEVKEK